MVQVLMNLLKNSKKRYEQDKDKTELFSQQLAQQMQGEEVQILKMIGDADKEVEGIDKRDAELEKWSEVYEASTYKFRKDVAAKMGTLSDDLSSELGLIAESSEKFQFNLDNYAEGAK